MSKYVEERSKIPLIHLISRTASSKIDLICSVQTQQLQQRIQYSFPVRFSGTRKTVRTDPEKRTAGSRCQKPTAIINGGENQEYWRGERVIWLKE